MKTQQTFYEVFRQQGISRRSFNKFCALTAASLGLAPSFAPKIAHAMETKPRTPVIWLNGLECTCCSESFIRSGHPLASDVVLSMLKRGKMASLDKTMMGTAITNLTRMDFPREYGSLELDRLILKPGGAYPMVSVNLVVGVVTCAGKLSLLIEYVEDNVSTGTMEKIKETAMGFLFGE